MEANAESKRTFVHSVPDDADDMDLCLEGLKNSVEVMLNDDEGRKGDIRCIKIRALAKAFSGDSDLEVYEMVISHSMGSKQQDFCWKNVLSFYHTFLSTVSNEFKRCSYEWFVSEMDADWGWSIDNFKRLR